MTEDFEAFLSQLANALEFKSLKPDPQGACLIIMKQGWIPLLFEFDDRIVPGSILVSSPIGPSSKNQTELLQALLKQNTSIEETVSWKEDDQQIYLHRRFSPDIPLADLKQALDSFLDQVNNWRKKLAQNASAIQSPSTGELYQQNLKA